MTAAARRLLLPMAAWLMLACAAGRVAHADTPELVVLGDPHDAATQSLLRAIHQRFLPNKLLALRKSQAAGEHRSPALAELFAGKAVLQTGEPTLFVCENFACQAPLNGQAALDWVEKATKQTKED